VKCRKQVKSNLDGSHSNNWDLHVRVDNYVLRKVIELTMMFVFQLILIKSVVITTNYGFR